VRGGSVSSEKLSHKNAIKHEKRQKSGPPPLWSYFPNKANKWNFWKHEKKKKNVNFKNYDTLRLKKCKNMF
jgi:hypothetical protein